MSDPSFHFAERLMDMNVEEAQCEAEDTDLARQATGGKRTWLQRQGCWLLSRLGHLMVAAGERLLQYGLLTCCPSLLRLALCWSASLQAGWLI